MPTTTTLPATLETVFLAFRENLPKGGPQTITVYNAWYATFDGRSRRESEMYSRVGQVADILEETLLQIESADGMTEARKSYARSVVSSFLPTVALAGLHQSAAHLVSTCSVNNCGGLGMIGDALRPQFSENVLSADDVTEILDALISVRSQLDDADLPLRLKVSLKRQIDTLIWRLKHPEYENLQQAIDALGSATLTAVYIERLCPENEPEVREKAKAIRNRLTGTLALAVSVADGGNKVVEFGKTLRETAKLFLPGN